MFEKFDDDARRSIHTAKNHIRGLNRSLVETPHLLLALITESTEVAGLLAAVGVTYDNLFMRLALVSASSSNDKTERRITYSPEFQKAVHDGAKEAADSGSPSVTPAHLLSALLIQRSGIALQTLRAIGVDIEDLRASAKLLFSRM